MNATPDPLELFIKLLGMTTSDNDNVALMAMKKANAYLKTKLNSDWEGFVRGKIKVEADPFATAPVVAPGPSVRTGYSQPQPAPYTPPPPKHFSGIEITEWIDKLAFRNLPSFTQRRLNDIEKSWSRNGYLLQGEYDELRRLAQQRQPKRGRP